MDDYTLIIFAGLIGFGLLAVLLLAPVYFFLQKEKRVSSEWTAEAIAQQIAEDSAATNGHSATSDGGEIHSPR